MAKDPPKDDLLALVDETVSGNLADSPAFARGFAAKVVLLADAPQEASANEREQG